MRNKRLAVFLIVMMLGLFHPSVLIKTAHAAPVCTDVCIDPAQDVFLDKDGYYEGPESGIDNKLYVGSDPTYGTQVAFLQFELDSIDPGRDIQSAELHVHIEGLFGSPHLDLDGLHDDSTWPATSDTSGTYAPTGSVETIAASDTNISSGWKAVDVTDYVKAEMGNGDTYATFRLGGPEGTAAQNMFYFTDSSAGTNIPRLEITYVPNTPRTER